jgi:hypothetical protein
MEFSAQRLEGCIDPVYYPVWGENTQNLKLASITQNSGYPPIGQFHGENAIELARATDTESSF